MNRIFFGKSLLVATALTCLFQVPVRADNEVYLCVGEGGVKEYKNTGDLKGCSKVSLPPLTTTSGDSGAKAVTRPTAAAPANFPKVDDNTQRSRDDDRKRLLQDELRNEQAKMNALQKDYNNGAPERQGNERNYAKYQERVSGMKTDIDRSQQNIDALQRELGQSR